MNTIKGFRGNKNIKRKGVPIEWTQEMVSEYIKCKNDIFYFIKNYYKIVTEDGIINMVLYDYQKETIASMVDNRFTMMVQSRQSGKTEAFRAFIIWFILFNDYKTISVVADKEKTANEIIGKIQLSYQQLPIWLQQGIVEFNKGSIILENESRVFASATSSSSLVGFTVHIIIIDEAALIENWDDFYGAVRPTISAGKETKLIMASTPRGLNHYYEFFQGSNLGEGEKKGTNGFKAFFIPWDRVPGRDEKWKQQELASMNYNYAKFDQEYNCAWLGSSGTLISGDALRDLQQKTKVPQITLENNSLKVFEHPIKQKKEYVNGLERIVHPDHIYAMVADVSRGKGLDYSAFSVFDITNIPYRQVCTYRDNEISPTDYAEIIHRVVRIYNNANVLIEINDIGDQVPTMLLDDFAYENIICSESAGRAGKRASFYTKKADRGIRTSAPVKNSGCLILKLLIEQGKLQIFDHETVTELTTFSKVKETYKAEKGKHDDMVMTLVLFAWLSDQSLFEEITAINTFNSFSEKTSEELDEQFEPAFGALILSTSDIMPGFHKVHNLNIPWNPFYIGGYAPEATIVPDF